MTPNTMQQELDHADARRLKALRAALKHCNDVESCADCKIPPDLCLDENGLKLYEDFSLDRLADALGIE